MKPTFLFLLTILMVNFSAYSQDQIIKKDGQTLKGQIQSEDDENIYFLMYRTGKNANTFINKADVDTVIYEEIVPNNVELDNASFGLGFGQMYGGIGVNACVYTTKSVGIFAGLGYAFAGVGYNLGTKIRFIDNENPKLVNAFITAMYGYNAAIKVQEKEEYNKMYYGATIGFGLDIRSRNIEKTPGYYSIALLIPFRSSEVNEYMDYLESYKGVEFQNQLLPITISFGYNF